jgi:hypothetical protein
LYLEAEFFTYDHVVRGFFDLPQERLSDYLNLKNDTTIVIHEAKISRLLGLGETPPVELPEIRMEKEAILFAYPTVHDMSQRSFYRKANRLVFPVAVLLPKFLLTGHIYLTEKFEIRRVLLARPEDFIPLTDVTATYSLLPASTVKKGMMVFNKKHMVLIGQNGPEVFPLKSPTEPRPF